MQIDLIPHAQPYGIFWPDNIFSVIGILLITGVIALMLRAEIRRGGRRVRVNWFFITVLAILGVIFNLFLVVSLGQKGAIQTTGMNNWDGRYVVMLLSAIPWMLSAGLFGGIPGAVVGLLSGATHAFIVSHSVVTPLETTLLAVIFAWLVKQPYRTAFFHAARHPIIASIIMAVVAAPVHVVTSLLTGNGSLYLRLDQIFSTYPAFIFIAASELILSGCLCEAFYKLAPTDLLFPEYLTPSPGERNLQARFSLNMAPWILILLIYAALAAWHQSEKSAVERLIVRAQTTSEAIITTTGSFVQSNRDQIKTLATDTRLFNQDPAIMEKSLQEALNAKPLFSQYIVVDRNMKVLAGYPKLDYLQGEPEGVEAEEITRTFQDGETRLASLTPLRDGRSAQISFIQALQGDNPTPIRVLIGRSAFLDNPQGQLLMAALEDAQESGMTVVLIDENGYVIFHPSTSQLMANFFPTLPEDDGIYQTRTERDIRQWLYYRRIPQTGWGVTVLTPGWTIQEEVLHIAGLMVLLSFGIVLLVCGLIWLSLGGVSKTISRLTADAEKIAGGQLSIPIRPVNDSDEIGQLTHAFEKMRGALKNRMDELNSLVEVSQGVASSLAIQEALEPILEAALGDDASAARIIIDRLTDDDSGQSTGYGTGPSSEAYAYLDDQIAEMTRAHGQLVIGNLHRSRVLTYPPEKSHPAALMAIPLQSEEEEHGVFWVAYDSPRDISDEEIRFIKTLAGEAVSASSNARLYDSAALGRQRLEAVLNATPDPVLVIDQKARVILLNPAAQDLAGSQEAPLIGKPAREIFPQEELRKLLTAVGDERVSKEIQYSDGRLFYATLSPVILDGKQVGKACLLRDVTRFKELDGLKTEFVATVSHDLRSPLLTARGYASMLSMVGELNEQQKSYLQKILDGIDAMSELVNDLLDPDRLKGGKTLKMEMVEIGAIVKNTIETLQQQAIQKKIDLQVDLKHNERKPINTDPALLERALYNLVENAIKYAPVKGTVSLVVQTSRTHVTFQVSDNGNGIAPLDLPHIFDRPPLDEGGLDSSKTSWGLSIVKTIAERHGGRVWVDSQLGRGSTFYMELPVNFTD